MHTNRIKSVTLAFGALLIGVPVALADGAIPAHLQGKWAIDGKCNVAKDALQVEAHAVTFAGQPAQKSQFDEDGGPSGDGVITDAPDDGVVGGIAYVKNGDRLLTYPNGFDAGSDAEYKRCK